MDTITSTAQDYLKVIWSATEWDGKPITTKALAERFGTTAATASDTIKRLTAQGLITHEPYRAIILTPLGEKHALEMVRRHRLIEAFLVTSLGYAWDEVHDEAENLEHSVSDLMIDRIDVLLGHPSADPHGDPIPAKDGTVAHTTGAVRLTDAAPGRYRVIRVSDSDSDRLSYFLEKGFVPGATISVKEWNRNTQTMALQLGDHELTLAAQATDAVILCPLAAPGRGSPAAGPRSDRPERRRR